MQDKPNIDYAGLVAFILGECTADEQKHWEQWVRQSEENRKVYTDCVKILEPEIDTKDKEFDSAVAWHRIRERLELPDANVRHMTPSRSLPVWIRYAAVFILGGVLITYLVWFNKENSVIRQEAGINSYYLPDSSKVTLNGSASLSYNPDFEDREVSLKGKAFFEVTRQEEATFTIKAREASIRVLGTSFLVEENENQVRVEVTHGLVSVALESKDETVRLAQNEQGIIDLTSQSITKDPVKANNSLYWANQQLTYRQASLPEVFDELSVLFGKDIEFDRSVLQACKLTALFRDQTFEQIMQNISVSVNLSYELDGDRVLITNADCE